MHVNIQAVTPSTMHLVEPGASVEMFWETENRNDIEQMTRDDLVFNKQIWMQNTHLTWGICGYTAFVDNGDATANPVPAATVFLHLPLIFREREKCLQRRFHPMRLC